MNNTTTTIPGAGYTTIPSSWENVKRALAESVRGNGCAAAVKIVVRVDEYGNPLQHSKPEVIRLEPRSNGCGVCECGWLEALGG